MRLAWFHPGPLPQATDASDAADLARELGRTHTVDQFDERRAHDFVWQQFTAPYDLAVFELADTRRHAFVWPYLFHYPGVVVLRSASLQHCRGDALRRARRDTHLRAERRFGGWNLLRTPLWSARVVVVHDQAMATELRDEFPSLQVRVVPVGVAPASTSRLGGGCQFRATGAQRDVIERAASRARQAGIELMVGDLDPLGPDDVVVALEWPPAGAPPPAALRAMAAGLPVIVLETEAVATWPTIDPQTWQPRGYLRDVTPVAVSIDPRDEEHSLMLAMRRLAADAPLRASLGRAARAWTHRYADVSAAAAAWEPILREAVTLAPLATRDALPPHVTDDGTAVARSILAEFGTAVDLFTGEE